MADYTKVMSGMSGAAMARHAVSATWLALALTACIIDTPGYNADEPGRVTCGCEGPDACYEGASSLASARGETAETGEELMYFAQCACFQGSRAGCNTLGHFARDFIRDCAEQRNVRDACAITGYIFAHGVQIPPMAGRSYDRNDAMARTAFRKACDAGATVVCDRAGPPKSEPAPNAAE